MSKKAILSKSKESLTKYYRGRGKNAWKKLGGGEKHLAQERKSWK